MKKEDYLKLVQPFVQWLSENLYSGTFEHSYINRRNQQALRFSSIYDAYENYQWNHPEIGRLHVPQGNSFASNAEALSALREDLIVAIRNGSDEDTLRAACDVVKWGGVAAGNTNWLIANKTELAVLLAEVRDALDSGDSQHNTLTDPALRFNAGMTKVYSLISKDFIIYDSRVAAALGLAVVKYVENGNAMISELAFPWAPAKEGVNARNPKNRNPGTTEVEFPRLNSGPFHAQWNLKASWLLSAVIEQDKKNQGRFSGLEDALRGIEAALFMIGYDLPGSSAAAGDTLTNNGEPPTSDGLFPGPWTECCTLVRRNPFEYRLTEGGIEDGDGRTFSDQTINGTLNSLRSHFDDTPFPLSNNAENVSNGTAEMGLGVAYYKICGESAPHTSRLAAILEDLQILIRAHVKNARGLHWVINPDLAGLGPVGTEIDVRPILIQIRIIETEA